MISSNNKQLNKLYSFFGEYSLSYDVKDFSEFSVQSAMKGSTDRHRANINNFALIKKLRNFIAG